MSKPFTHGTTNGYVNRVCRCQPCRDAFAAWMRSYKARNKAKLAAMRAMRHRRFNLAADFVKSEFPDLWQKWTDEIKYELGLSPDAPDA